MLSPLKTYPLVTNPDGTHSIQGVEIFRLGKHRDFDFSPEWFERARANFAADRDKGYLPPVMIGHNDGGFFGPAGSEKPAVAFADNLRLSESEPDTVLVDYLLASAGDGLLKLFKAYPQRSVELATEAARFTAVAQLGGTEPYHKFAPLNPVPLQFKARTEAKPDEADPKRMVIPFESASDITIAGETTAQTLRRELNDLEYALWDAMWKVRDDKEMTAEAKKAKLDQLIEEWAGIYAEKEKALVDAEAGVTETTSADFKARFTALAAALLSSPVGTQPAVSSVPETAFTARETQLRERILTLENDRLKTRFSELAQAGLAKPVLDSLLAIRKAFLTGEGPSVQFTAEEGQPAVSKPLADALDSFCDQIAARLRSNSLFVAYNKLPSGDPTDPLSQLADRQPKEDHSLNEEAAKKINQFMADNKWTADRYSEAMHLLRDRGEITYS